jgi:hypothetical protein
MIKIIKKTILNQNKIIKTLNTTQTREYIQKRKETFRKTLKKKKEEEKRLKDEIEKKKYEKEKEKEKEKLEKENEEKTKGTSTDKKTSGKVFVKPKKYKEIKKSIPITPEEAKKLSQPFIFEKDIESQHHIDFTTKGSFFQ